MVWKSMDQPKCKPADHKSRDGELEHGYLGAVGRSVINPLARCDEVPTSFHGGPRQRPEPERHPAGFGGR